MRHIVLLGDSVFDNGAYTRGEPDVAAHLRSLAPPAWRVSLCALDGARCTDVTAQMRAAPANATHLVLSVGGNDALANSDLLHAPVRSTAEALALFGRRLLRFRTDYEAAVDAVMKRPQPAIVCTIYEGDLPADEAPNARVALALFNDVILRTAFARRLSVIDLRLVCTERADYANPIEPSGSGGRKIAATVLAATRDDATRDVSKLYIYPALR